MNIIKLKYESNFENVEPMDYSIRYLRNLNLDGVMQAIEEINKQVLGNGVSDEDILLTYFKDTTTNIDKDILEDINIDESLMDHESFSDYKSVAELIKNGYLGEVLDYMEYQLVDTESVYSEIVELNNCNFGTVGHSDWSYYIAYKDASYTLVSDLWNSYDFYVMEYIKDGKVIDSMGQLYLPNEKELDNVLMAYFGIDKDDYYLVDNEVSKYMDKPKAKEIKTIKYEYLAI